jgi:methylated-DNA-[protein]-cysteine S-methyltransferase
MNAVTMDTPIGRLTALVSDRGVRAMAFGDDPRLAGVPAGSAPRVTSRLDAYFAGDLAALDGIEVDMDGTPWQSKVWAELRRVPAGETRTYAELARDCGTRSARAAGSACARNPVGLIVPCHRIVGTDGSLRGYAWGLDRKRWLLEHERAV